MTATEAFNGAFGAPSAFGHAFDFKTTTGAGPGKRRILRLPSLDDRRERENEMRIAILLMDAMP